MLLIPAEYNWESLTVLRCADLESHYSTLLRELGTQKGILGKIFTKSQNKNKDPAKISKLIDMIDKEQWNVLGADVKARYTKGCWRRTLNWAVLQPGPLALFPPTGLICKSVPVLKTTPTITSQTWLYTLAI